jgi:diadenosine tetraphosphate (Ap4A) HIT family hydrolase
MYFMKGCPTCEKWGENRPNKILENAFARATFSDHFREGHCVITVKRHMVSISSMNAEEHSAVLEMITKVSKALEKKYKADKTYLLAIGDSDEFQHLHFHLIPKHKDLPSMGVYCFRKLDEIEPARNTPDNEKKAVASELKSIIESFSSL